MRTLPLAILTLGACSGGGSPDAGRRDAGPVPDVICEEKLSLVDSTAWRLVAAADDPFLPAPSDARTCPAPPETCAGRDVVCTPPVAHVRCADSDVRSYDFGGEPAFAVQTRLCCGWATATQPLLVPIAAGDPIFFRVWHFAQMSYDRAEVAHIDIRLGDDEIGHQNIPLGPTDGMPSQLFFPSDPPRAPRDAPAGTPVWWHIDNKGANEYDFIELSVTRPAPCAD